METKSYFFTIDKKFFKQGYVMYDENKEKMYEAKMLKWTLFRPFVFQFINHKTSDSVEHKVGHTLTIQEENGGIMDMFSTKSSFKFDGKDIWDYLHDKGVRINSQIMSGSIGMTYTVTYKGIDVATISMASPSGKKRIIVSDFSFNIETEDEYLDLAFLCAFAFARTSQVFYD